MSIASSLIQFARCAMSAKRRFEVMCGHISKLVEFAVATFYGGHAINHPLLQCGIVDT